MRKLRFALAAAGFVLAIVVAVVAYNAFAARVDPVVTLALPGERGDMGDGPRQRAPDFDFTDWDGNVVSFSDIVAGGKPIVLNFWASWCPACRNEKPGFESVYRERGEEVKFVMLGLADGMRETVESGQRYIEAGGFTLPVYFDTMQEGARAHGIRFLPTTVFIDADGYIVAGNQGIVSEETLQMAIDFMLR